MPSIDHVKTDRIAVSQREAARILGVDTKKILEAVHSGALIVRKAPSGVASRILVTDLLAWFLTWERKPARRPRKQKDEVNAEA
ncbi:hypothetical protein L6654_19610 [Bradyrhizobium sp. WYCCWR 13023]|uniref:Uncharacterized protein n=1 Tax=Bradyrhizobium zhengyangense TaxID=2911009 RepID=A0A9X1UHW5_9BRAD|nr:hypothetical protein [Bradyrhizobium zhengyangense]MCG2628847.1 hypothetical protein [Bradyrhizobium zhengyangense]